jgi:hypothetical protein
MGEFKAGIIGVNSWFTFLGRATPDCLSTIGGPALNTHG